MMSLFRLMIFYFLLSLTASVVGQWKLKGLGGEMSQPANRPNEVKAIGKWDTLPLQFSHLRQGFLQKAIAKPLRVRHQPSEDFNVYLVVDHHFVPNIKTTLELSINYTGIMNLRHTIVLRKKKK